MDGKKAGYKNSVLDLGGTLLTDESTLSLGNRKALTKALAAEMSLDQKGCFLIAFNGGEIYDCGKKKNIYKKTIPLNYVRYIFDAAKKAACTARPMIHIRS